MSSTVKVSALPAATLPLSGTELVMLVQSGVSRQAPASAFLAAVVTLGAEQVVVATAGTMNNVVIDVASVSRVLVDTSAGDVIFTGMTAGTDGQLMVVTNGAANLLTLADENAGSLAANRYYGVTDISLPPRGSQLLSYSGTLFKWVMV
jgi:sugar/nucleoside kinase (ribokinase family)